MTANHVIQLLSHLAVFKRQALQHAAHDLTLCLGHGLLGFVAEGLDSTHHVAWCQEAAAAQRHETESSGPLCAGVLRGGSHAGQFIVGVRLACSAPFTAAFLDQPESHDILEEAKGVVDAALVGKVVVQALVGDDWVVELDTHE